MKQRYTTESDFLELFTEHVGEKFGCAEVEMSVARQLLSTREGQLMGAARTLGIVPQFERGASRSMNEMQDAATLPAIPRGLLLDPATDAGRAVLLFLHLQLTLAKARRDIALYGPFYWFFMHGDERALDWEKEEIHLTFAYLFDEMLEETPAYGVEWHDSGLSLNDLLTEKEEGD